MSSLWILGEDIFPTSFDNSSCKFLFCSTFPQWFQLFNSVAATFVYVHLEIIQRPRRMALNFSIVHEKTNASKGHANLKTMRLYFLVF